MWPSTTAGYGIDDTITQPISIMPDAAQEALMDQSYQADGIIDSNVAATVGMFGYTDSVTNESSYWFYFYFKQATLY